MLSTAMDQPLSITVSESSTGCGLVASAAVAIRDYLSVRESEAVEWLKTCPIALQTYPGPRARALFDRLTEAGYRCEVQLASCQLTS